MGCVNPEFHELPDATSFRIPSTTAVGQDIRAPGVMLAAALAVVAGLLSKRPAIHGGSAAWHVEPRRRAAAAGADRQSPALGDAPATAPAAVPDRPGHRADPHAVRDDPDQHAAGIPDLALDRLAQGREGTLIVPGSPNARLARIDLSRLKLRWTRVHVSIDLGRATCGLIRDGEIVAPFPAATAARSTPTPPGRFSVTDRITFPAGSIYGGFALGLSAHQTSPLPAGWTGGDQIAIHGTDDPASIGRAASLGCLRVGTAAFACSSGRCRWAPRSSSTPERATRHGWSAGQPLTAVMRSRSGRDVHRAVRLDRPVRVVRDLPGMAVGIGEQARVAAPERLCASRG